MQPEKSGETQELMVIPLFEIVVYPESRTKFQVDQATGDLLLEAMKDEKHAHAIGLTVKSGTRPQELTGESFYKTGNLFHVAFVQPADEGYVICAEVVQRVRIVSIDEKEGRFFAAYQPVPDIEDLEDELKNRILADIKLTLHEMSSRFSGSEQFTQPIDRMDTADQIMGFVMPFLPVHLSEKQALLEIVSVKERYITFLELLMKTRETISIRIEMAKKVTDRVSKSNREAMLREQLRVIQEELGESDGTAGEGGYRERIENSKMPDDVRKKALVEAKKLETGGSQNHESSVIRNYLDLLLDLPWVTEEKKSIDIAEARRVLESHHNGLEKVKERIIQHLAVMKLKAEKQGSILLFTGPPGTGKTSLGKSIAEALGRKYVRISLGGVRDEAEIRGTGGPMSAPCPGGSSRASRKQAQRTRSSSSTRSTSWRCPTRATRQVRSSRSSTPSRTTPSRTTTSRSPMTSPMSCLSQLPTRLQRSRPRCSTGWN